MVKNADHAKAYRDRTRRMLSALLTWFEAGHESPFEYFDREISWIVRVPHTDRPGVTHAIETMVVHARLRDICRRWEVLKLAN